MAEVITIHNPRAGQVYRSRRTGEVALCQHRAVEPTAETFPPPNGLGDHTSDLLASVGITKERFSNAVNAWNTSDEKKDCGCNWRQKGMNWIGSKLGLPEGKGPELQKLLELEHLPEQPVYECELHGKCLTQLRLANEQRQIVVDSGFTPCNGCEDFKPKACDPVTAGP